MTPTSNVGTQTKTDFQHLQSTTDLPADSQMHNGRDVRVNQSLWLPFLTNQLQASVQWLTGWAAKNVSSTNTASTAVSEKRKRLAAEPREYFFDALTPEQWDEKYRQITLRGDSDQLMQWVVFNDSTNSARVGGTPPLRTVEITQLETILQNLEKNYPVGTPTVHFIYEIFQPELLTDDQINQVNTFFQQLSQQYKNLRVASFQDVKGKNYFGETIAQIKEKIIQCQQNGLFLRINISNQLDDVLGRNIVHFQTRYGNDVQLIWQNMLKRHSWLTSFDGEDILSVYDATDDGHEKMFTQFKQQLDNMSLTELESVALENLHRLPVGLKGIYTDLQRFSLLYNPQGTTGCEQSHSLIHRDFDTRMTGAMPDIDLPHGKILGVPSFLSLNAGMVWEPITLIAENGVMGVAVGENPHLKSILEKSRTDIVQAIDSGSLIKGGDIINNYNYAYNQLDNILILLPKSTFECVESISLRTNVI